MVECEVWLKSANVDCIIAKFAVVPRIGEQVIVPIDPDHAKLYIVQRIRHVDLNVHGNVAGPTIQLWVEDAPST